MLFFIGLMLGACLGVIVMALLQYARGGWSDCENGD
jgi:hypothetical protein